MDLVVIDDSKQKKPSRPGMGSLVAVGGLHIPSEGVRALERTLEETCKEYGFPSHQDEFKWSPSRKSWMRKSLIGEGRGAFFIDCLEAAKEEGAEACVVIEDTSRRSTAGNYGDHELDAVKVFLERTDHHLASTGTEAVLMADHPTGGRPAEARFVAHCIETLREGTQFMDLERTALVVTEDSKSHRLLQLADLIVGCTLAYVSGEDEHSPSLFNGQIKGMLREEGGRIGGVGLKLHPDFNFANLYHWLLGDDTLWKGIEGQPLPMKGRAYVNGPTDDSLIKAEPTGEGLLPF
jgi:hypothetical protein